MNFKGDVRHKSSYQHSNCLGNGVEKNHRQNIHQSARHLELLLLKEVIELMIVAAEGSEATHVNVTTNLEAGHVIVIGSHLEAGHVIVKRNLGADHESSLGIDHVNVLVGGAGRHVIETDGVDRVINAEEVGHVIVSDGVDHVRGTGGETLVEPAVDMIEEKMLDLVRKMKVVILKSELYHAPFLL